MAKYFKDFTFMGKKFKEQFPNYISLDFDENPEINLAMGREMDSGNTNRFRIEANYFGDKWSDGLEFQLHITKNPDKVSELLSMEITKEDIREITRWLTSPHSPTWIEFENMPEDNYGDATRYKGWFNNIETFVVDGVVYGLKLFFKCTTPFAYTGDIAHIISPVPSNSIMINNDSDELYNYCYPTIDITPSKNGQIYICNTSDCEVLSSGTLSLTSTDNTYLYALMRKISDYADLHGYDVKYNLKDDESLLTICNDTALEFYFVDVYDVETKCAAFYLPSSKEFKIIKSGFMWMNVYKGLDIHIDCQRLLIYDSIGRMVKYDKLGIKDVDNMYWVRLLHGNNSFLVYGDGCRFEFRHRESRKVGE